MTPVRSGRIVLAESDDRVKNMMDLEILYQNVVTLEPEPVSQHG